MPKKLVDEAGQLTGERNDVALAGLNHKLGYRGIPNTLLNFGEGKHPVRGGSGGGLDGAGSGAVGYLVGQPGDGLRCMFHMMNEARIAVGLGAVMLGVAGYEASLAYAKERPQGRPVGVGGKDPTQPQVAIVGHADVKRMLLAQKSYCEGALALELYCARLVDEQHTGAPEAAADAALLLEMLTPIAKSWPSEWCLEANSLAIQVLGGYGYTRDFPVEQYWRDNRLNMIHEGTHGIQGAGPARPQGRDAGGRRAGAARRAHDGDHRARRGQRGAGRTRAGARVGPRTPARRDACSLGRRRTRGDAGQRDALPAGLRPRRAGVDLARRRARCRAPARRGRRRRLQCAAGCTPAATSSATNCRASAPGSASSRRATTLAGRWMPTGSEPVRTRTVPSHPEGTP